MFFLAAKGRKAQNQFLLDDMGIMRFAKYAIEPVSHVFRHRADFLAWEAINDVEARFECALAGPNTGM